MGTRRAIFELLAKEANTAVEPALLAALAGADEALGREIIATLLARGHRAGLSGLVAHFHLLSEPLKELVLGAVDDLIPLLREAFQKRSDQARLNVIELIRRGGLYRASYLLEAALHDPSTEVFGAAAATLYELADRSVVSRGRNPSGATSSDDPEATAPRDINELRRRMQELEVRHEDRRQIAAALLAALGSARLHMQPTLVEAALWLADEIGIKLWTSLAAPGGKVLRLAAWAFESSRSPRMVPFAMAAMNHAEFRPYIMRALATCTDPAFWEEWCRQAWRVRHPAIGRNMGVVRELACLSDRSTGLLALSPAAQRHAAAWLQLTGIALETKLTCLRDMQRRGSRAAQRAAVWTLCGISDSRASSVLGLIAGDGDSESSRMARLELGRRQPQQYRPKDLLASVRAMPLESESEEEAPAGPMRFEDYWAAFDTMSEPERAALGKDILLGTAGGEAALRRHLNSQDASQRVRALRVMIVSGLVERFAEQVYALAHDCQAEVRSAAVVALGKLGDATSRLLLHGALLDSDARVQANAIEAIDKLGEHFDPSDLLPKLSSSDNRVRANAVGALLKLGVREAAETLLQMLEDDSRSQRVSALWLVENMGLAPLAARVMRIADKDQDPQVRERARKLAERLSGREAAAADLEGVAT